MSQQPVLDQTRRLVLVTADGAVVPADAVWRFGGEPRSCVRRLLDRAAVAVAGDSLGVAEAMLEATVGYAGVRERFGRPIGSFQAVKHACADMLVQVSSVAASMAKSYARAAAVDAAGKAMQLHGGMGYTWESSRAARARRGSGRTAGRPPGRPRRR